MCGSSMLKSSLSPLPSSSYLIQMDQFDNFIFISYDVVFCFSFGEKVMMRCEHSKAVSFFMLVSGWMKLMKCRVFPTTKSLNVTDEIELFQLWLFWGADRRVVANRLKYLVSLFIDNEKTKKKLFKMSMQNCKIYIFTLI